MSTTGERTFTSEGRKVVPPKQQLIPNGEYPMELQGTVDIAKGKSYNSVPYLNISFEVEGTAAKEGAKNRKAFHMLKLGITEGADGVSNVDRIDGAVALATALGTAFEGIEIVEQSVTNPETGEVEKLEYLNPQQMRDWLKTFAGSKIKGRIGTRPGQGEYGPKNEIKSFRKAE